LSRRKRRREWIKDLAVQRAEILLNLSHKTYAKDPELARRYVKLAVSILKRARAKLPRKLKRTFCKSCFEPLIPGVTARVRLRNNRMPHIVITCLRCGRRYRVPYKR